MLKGLFLLSLFSLQIQVQKKSILNSVFNTNISVLYLQSLDFDKFLEPVNDEELLVLGIPGDVASVQPAVDDGLLGGLLVAVVTLHHLWTGNTQLAILNNNNYS